jgi:hypothetical protein
LSLFFPLLLSQTITNPCTALHISNAITARAV